AEAAGASAFLVRADVTLPVLTGNAAVVRVDDPLSALGRLAGAVRDRLTAKVVAITGSSGKTITKEMTAAVARTRYRTAASAASFNNEIGVPLTILAADAETEVLVVEVGSRGVGHIASLTPVIRPDGDAAVRLRIPGEHLVSAALAAAAAGHALGVAAAASAEALSSTPAVAWRMQVSDAPGGWRVVNDAYNANPASTAAALKALV